MITTFKMLSLSVAGLALSACGGSAVAPVSKAPSKPTAAEKACLAAVAKSTRNSEVTVLSSEFSEAGTFVKVGVGPDSAPWQCIAYKDGATDGIQSLSDEGSL